MHGADNPNADSMRFLAGPIWPAVRKATGGATLIIVGYGTDAAVSDLGTEGIQVVGAQTGPTSFYNDARVFIVPTRYAAGLPYKAHEAAAHGVPMVVSDVIARQPIGATEKTTSWPRIGPVAANCIRLYRDGDSFCEKLRSNALKHAEVELSERQSQETLSRLMMRVSDGHDVNPA